MYSLCAKYRRRVTMRVVGLCLGMVELLSCLTLAADPARSEQGGARFAVTVQIVPTCVRRFDFSVTRHAVTPTVATDASGSCNPGRDVAARLQAATESAIPAAADAAVRVGIADLEAGKRITLTTDAPAEPSASSGIWRVSLDF